MENISTLNFTFFKNMEKFSHVKIYSKFDSLLEIMGPQACFLILLFLQRLSQLHAGENSDNLVDTNIWSTAWRVSVFGVILVRIQSKCGKIRTRVTPNMDSFYAVEVALARNFKLECLFIVKWRPLYVFA